MELTWVLHVGFFPTVISMMITNRAPLVYYRLRDSPAPRALTSLGYSDPTGMTVEECVGYCSNPTAHVYAGLENGTDCCKCASASLVKKQISQRQIAEMS